MSSAAGSFMGAMGRAGFAAEDRKERKAINGLRAEDMALRREEIQAYRERGTDFIPQGGGVEPAGGAGSFTLPSGDIASRIRSGLINRGMPEHVADGWLMNFQDESTLNPGINEAEPTVAGSRGGFGLAQWTGPRRVALEGYAKAGGRNVADVDTQLDYLMTELAGPESRAGKSIMSARNAGEAGVAIARDFLRPAKEHLDRRTAKYRGYVDSALEPVRTATDAGLETIRGKVDKGLEPVRTATAAAPKQAWGAIRRSMG